MDIMRALNSRNKNLQVDVQVITLADNLEHPYFSLIELSKNNLSPIGIAKMEAPYTPHISHYWIKYQGEIVISFNMADLKPVNTNSEDFFNYVNKTEKTKFYERLKQQKEKAKEDEKKTEEKANKEPEEDEEYVDMKSRFQNDHYNYSFIGKVSRFKQKGNKFVVYFEDLGWKFLQKVPKEFRDTYVAGQYLDDAFQAMCEFMGVDFAYSIEDLHEYTFGTDGYSVQKDGQTIEDVSTILSEWSQKDSEEEETDPLDDPMYENQDLQKLDEENKDNKNYVKSDNSTTTNNTTNSTTNNGTNAENSTEGEIKENDEATQQEEEVSVDDKIEKYQEEFDQKVLDLFIGNSYYESDLINPILNYNSITITPRVVSTDNGSTMSAVSGDATTAATGENPSTDLLSQGQTGITLQNVNFNVPKTALSYDQVNAMSPLQAREEATLTNKYYWTTILRLRARAAAYQVGPNTPYSKFNY